MGPTTSDIQGLALALAQGVQVSSPASIRRWTKTGAIVHCSIFDAMVSVAVSLSPLLCFCPSVSVDRECLGYVVQGPVGVDSAWSV